MNVLQLNTTVNSGSTGRIAEDIGNVLMHHGHHSYIAYAKGNLPSSSSLIRVGNKCDRRLHGLKSRLFDGHSLGSQKATEILVEKIKILKPDIIQLHNIHGYYLHIGSLFNFLSDADIPVVWTLHDCWPFTGHCSYFDRYECDKWKTECHHCPNIHGYPKSWFLDNSTSNYRLKKRLFNSVKNMTIITPSNWLASYVKQSFLKEYDIRVINNGVDLDVFTPLTEDIDTRYNLKERFVLGVASVWDRRKGLNDFIRLREKLDASINILLVGLSQQQIDALPKGIIGLRRTENVAELSALYSAATAFINPTYIDNFPTTNLEALACGTPVITYNTGGSPEAVETEVGMVVEKGDIKALVNAISMIVKQEQSYSINSRARAEKLYDKNYRLYDYLKLYENLLF